MSAAAPDGIDPGLWATMTEEERAGISGEEYSPEELSSIKKLAESHDGGDDDDDKPAGEQQPAAKAAEKADGGDDAAKPAGEQPAGASSDDAAAGADDSKADSGPSTPSQPAPAAMPVYKADLPQDFEARLEAVKSRESEAWAKFDSGDLTREELQAQITAINADREDLNRLRTKSEVSQEMTAQTAEAMWTAAISRSYSEFAKSENGGIDYRKDPAKEADLDHFVKALASADANADKPMEWFLQEAHKRVLALHGLSTKQPPETPAEANARRRPDLKVVPTNLSQVPGGDGPGDVGGEFADIDGLEGEEFEAAIAAMSPEKRARYSAAR